MGVIYLKKYIFEEKSTIVQEYILGPMLREN